MKPQIAGPAFDIPQVPGIQFACSPVPTVFVIDSNGILRSRTWGSKTPRFFSENVLPLLRAQ